MNKDLKQYLKRLKKQGYEWEYTRNGHIRIFVPGFPGAVTSSSTASDHRALRNVDAQVRKQLVTPPNKKDDKP